MYYWGGVLGIRRREAEFSTRTSAEFCQDTAVSWMRISDVAIL